MKIKKRYATQFAPVGMLTADISLDASDAKVQNGSDITLLAVKKIDGVEVHKPVGKGFKVGSWKGPVSEIPKAISCYVYPSALIQAQKEKKKNCVVTLYIRTEKIKK